MRPVWFLSAGGKSSAPLYGGYEADALYSYFHAKSPVMPAAAGRIARTN